MVLPALLDSAPRRRIATRKRSRPPGRVHHTLACGSALAHTRVLRAKGSTGTHDLLKVPTAANFYEKALFVKPTWRPICVVTRLLSTLRAMLLFALSGS